MLTSKDLMIGDWYAFRGHPYKCTANDIASLAECEEKGAPTDISEIPLTPEILEKNLPTYDGLVFEPSDMLDTIPAFTFRIDEDFAHIKIDLRYVHELQHTLRLCGIDLDIVI